MSKIRSRNATLSILVVIGAYFIFYLIFSSVKDLIKNNKVNFFPGTTNIYSEVFANSAWTEISRELTYYSANKAPISTFNSKKKCEILVYKLLELKNDKTLHNLIDVKIGHISLSNAGVFSSQIKTKYFEFSESYFKNPDSAKLSILIKGKLISEPIVSDSLLFYNMNMNKMKGLNSRTETTLFYAGKRFFLYDDMPVQLAFKKLNATVYMILLYPTDNNKLILDNDYLFKLLNNQHEKS